MDTEQSAARRRLTARHSDTTTVAAATAGEAGSRMQVEPLRDAEHPNSPGQDYGNSNMNNSHSDDLGGVTPRDKPLPTEQKLDKQGSRDSQTELIDPVISNKEKDLDSMAVSMDDSVTCSGTYVGKTLFKICMCVLAGIVFGWCMEKSRVFEPASIRLQMVFKRWIMLKMFLAAVAAGQVVFIFLSLIPQTKALFSHALTEFAGCFGEKGFLTSVVGGATLGIGMVVSGACPGMILIQVGAWSKYSIFTFLGVLVGALLYGLVAPWVVKATKPKKPLQIHTLHEQLRVHYAVVAIPFCVLMALTVFLMEWFIPWQDDLDYWNRNDNVTNTNNPFAYKSWPPSIAGVFVGSLQLVIVLVIGDTLGGSSSYMTLVSQWVVTDKLQKMFPYLAKARLGIGNWWQVMYVGSAILGGLFSSLSSNSLGTTPGVSIPSAIGGGVLLILGARLAAGCTSGHGLSGMAMLFWLSFIAVPSMFAGAIAVGFAMDATGALRDFQCHKGYDYMCT